MIRKTAKVKVKKGFILECTMENGELIEYDMSFLLNESGPIIDPLKDQDFFKRVFLEDGHLAWPNGLDIHSNTVVRKGKLIDKKAA
ncbi:MAG: DUF2442 domain-containing protein [Bacteriovoracales bacterium]|nr:DUF2442 domain-containing protein [Bacteriovoracales bacterium]